MKSYLNKLAAITAFAFLSISQVGAATLGLNNGLGGAAGGQVGTIDDGTPANLTAETIFVNQLLSMPASTFVDNLTLANAGTNDYQTTAHNFTGSVTSVGALDFPSNP